jgi:hypothetical protein
MQFSPTSGHFISLWSKYYTGTNLINHWCLQGKVEQDCGLDKNAHFILLLINSHRWHRCFSSRLFKMVADPMYNWRCSEHELVYQTLANGTLWCLLFILTLNVATISSRFLQWR